MAVQEIARLSTVTSGTKASANSHPITFQVSGTTTTGTGAATVNIEGSNDGTNWVVLGIISLTLATTATSDGFTTDAPWGAFRANVTAISGTGALVIATMSAL